MRGVAAVLVTADDRYLLQLRDDRPGVMMRGYWGLFGGWVKPGEVAEAALIRELDEELSFHADRVAWFTEATYLVPGVDLPPLHKTFFEVCITPSQIDAMVLREGAGMKLFRADEIGAVNNLIPWDGLAVTCHAKRNVFPQLHHRES